MQKCSYYAKVLFPTTVMSADARKPLNNPWKSLMARSSSAWRQVYVIKKKKKKKSILFLCFSPPLYLSLVCSPPGQSELSTGLYPGWRNQQDEAHWTPDRAVAPDLTTSLVPQSNSPSHEQKAAEETSRVLY